MSIPHKDVDVYLGMKIFVEMDLFFQIIEYSINHRKYTPFSNAIHDHLPTQWLHRSYPVHSITFDSRNNDIIVLGDDSTIMVINKKKVRVLCSLDLSRIYT